MAKKSNNGKSVIQGTTEDDILDGGNGKDVITGDAGNDEVIGGNGKDVLGGGSGDDAMSGDNGKDVMNFNALENMDSSNSFDGGRGKDTLNLDLANITITSAQYDELLRQLAELQADIAANGRANNEGDVDGGQDYTLDIEGVISLRVQNVEILNILNLNQVNIIPEAIDDDITLNEDSSFTLDVLANDFDRNNQEDALDDDVLSVVSFEDSMTIGSVINHGDGTFSYDTNGMFDYLAVGESTTDSFEYTISDGSGGFATATVHVTITGVNDGPEANNDVGNMTEDNAPIMIDALANDTDVDTSDTHTVDAASVTSGNGSVAIVDNQLQFTADHQHLAEGESEVVEIDYTMSDNHGADSSANAFVTVTGVNDAVADLDLGSESFSISEFTTETDASLSTVTLNNITFTDPDSSNEHTVTIDWGDGTMSESMVLPVGDRSFDLSHIYLEEGNFTATVTVSDGSTSMTQTFDVSSAYGRDADGNLIVTSFGDSDPNDPSVDADTLRDAVLGSNADEGADTILLDAGTYNLGLGDLDITGDLTIIGAVDADGNALTVIDANHLSRMFDVQSGASLTLQNVILVNGDSGYANGGAINVNSGHLSLDNVTIENSSANFGGAVSGANSSIEITNSLLQGNSANFHGGAIDGGNSTNITLNNTDVLNNTSIKGGAAVHVNNSSISIENGSLMDGNTTDGNGGAIVGWLASVSVSDSTLSNNDAGLHGGAIQGASFVSLNIENSMITDNSAGVTGGAITANLANDDVEVSISGTEISHNTSSGSAGAINATGSVGSFLISDSHIHDNSASGNAGAIYATTDVTIQSSVIEDNSAGVHGGAIYNSGAAAQLSIVDSVIGSNTAGATAGGIYMNRDSDATIDNSRLVDNEANGGGGAIRTNFGTTIVVTDSELSGNSSAYGDAIFTRNDSSATFINSTISGNTGVHAIVAGETSTIDIQNSTIANNNNIGVYAASDSQISLSSTIVAGNDDDVLGGGFVDNGNNLIADVDGSNISADSLLHGSASGDGVLDAGLGELQFVDGSFTQVHLLNEDSMAINRGAADASLEDDQLGADRDNPDGLVDIGAVEMQGDVNAVWLDISHGLDNALLNEDEAGTVNLSINFDDPDLNDSYTVNINWADGSVTNEVINGLPESGLQFSHEYSAEFLNAYNSLAVGESEDLSVSYSVTDGAGRVIASSSDVTVEGRNDGPVIIGDSHAAMSLNFDASLDHDNDRDLDSTDDNVDGFRMALMGGQGSNFVSVDSAYAGITSAVQFDGDINAWSGAILVNDAGQWMSLESLPGNPSYKDASFELWFKADDSSALDRKQMLFESGGNWAGLAIALDGRDIVVTIQESQASEETIVVSNAVDTNEFQQLVLTYDRDADGTANDNIKLYLDGAEVGSISVTDINDWAGGNAAAIGRVGSDSADDDLTAPLVNSGVEDNFDGQIAAFRFYESTLSAEEIQNAFDAVANGLVVIDEAVINDSSLHSEANDMNHSAEGVISFADVDLSDTHSVSVTPLSNGYLGSFNASIMDSTGSGFGEIQWNFNVDDSDISFLGEGQSLSQVYEITVDDGNGGTASHNVTVEINGANDGPTANADAVTTDENSDVTIDALANDTDPDANDSLTIVSANITSGMGNVQIIDNQLVFSSSNILAEYDFEGFAEGLSVDEVYSSVSATNGGGDIGSNSVGGSSYLVVGGDVGTQINFDLGLYTEGQYVISMELYLPELLADGSMNQTATTGGSAEYFLLYDSNNSWQSLTPFFGLYFDGAAEREPGISSYAADYWGQQPVPYDQWVDFRIEIDLDQDVIATYYNDELLATNTKSTDIDLSSITFNARGAHSYFVDNLKLEDVSNNVVGSQYDYLAVGESAEVEIEYTVADSHGVESTSTSTVTITGVNDNPEVGAALIVSTNEDNSELIINLLEGASDVDDSDELNVDSSSLGDLPAGVTLDGNNLVVDPSVYNHLAAGESEELVISFNIIDGNGGSVGQSVALQIAGRNDAPEIVSVNMNDTDGTIGFTDADLSDTHTVDHVANGENYVGQLEVSISQDSTGGQLGQIDLNFTVDAADIKYLGVDDSITQSYTILLDDRHSGAQLGDGSLDPGADWLVTMVGITSGNGATDYYIDNTTEALEIAESASDTGAVTASNGRTYNIDTYEVTTNTVIDYGGPWGRFDVDNAYPDGTLSDGGVDFLVTAEQNIMFKAGTYTLAINSDDGGRISLNGAAEFFNKYNSNNEIGGDEIRYEWTRGTSNTTGTFTVEEDTLINLSAIFFERGGGDLFEIGVAEGAHYGMNSSFELLQHGALDGNIAFIGMSDPIEHTIDVTIRGVNDNPEVEGALSATTNEDAANFQIDLLAGASDIDGDALSVDADSLSVTVDFSNPFLESFVDTVFDISGVTLNGNSLDVSPFVYNGLAVGETATITATYDIADGNGGSVTQTATITMEGRNDVPLAAEDSGATRINVFTGSGEDEGLDLQGEFVYALNMGGDDVEIAGVQFEGDSGVNGSHEFSNGISVWSGTTNLNFGNPNFDDGDGGARAGEEAGLETLLTSVRSTWQGDVLIDIDAGELEAGTFYQMQIITAERDPSYRVFDLYVDGIQVNTGELDNFYSGGWVDPSSIRQAYRSFFEGAVMTHTFEATGDAVNIVLHKVNHGAFISGFTLEKLPVPGLITEILDNAPGENVDDLTAFGDVRFTDVDLSDTHLMTFVADGEDYIGEFSAELAVDSTGNEIGRVDWSFTVNDAVIDSLGELDTIEQTYTITLDDGNGGTVSETAVVTIVGRNDAPTVESAIESPVIYADIPPPAASEGLIWFEDFDASSVGTYNIANGYVTDNGQWSVSSTGSNTGTIDPFLAQFGFPGGPNQWYIATAQAELEDDGAANNIGNTLYMGPDPSYASWGYVGAYYAAFESTHLRVESSAVNLIDASNMTNLVMEFDYLGVGELNEDYAHFQYKIAGTSDWVNIINSHTGNLWMPLSTTWVDDYQIELPDELDGQLFQLGINFISNGDNQGSDPSFAIDNIEINGTSTAPASGGSDDVGFIYSMDLLEGASDADASDTLSVDADSLSDLPDGVTVNGNTLSVDTSVYSNLAAGEQTTLSVSYNIIDGNGGSVPQSVSLTLEGRELTAEVVHTASSDNTELTGTSGSDRFVFGTDVDSDVIINDFATNEGDSIDLTAWTFADISGFSVSLVDADGDLEVDDTHIQLDDNSSIDLIDVSSTVQDDWFQL